MRSFSGIPKGFKRSAIALAIGQALIFQAEAATITVTTRADNEANDGLCSLREALSAANTNTSVDACAAGDDNADTIDFDFSEVDSTITLAGTELEITAGVTIDGDTDGDDEFDITVDADHQSRAIHVNTTEPVTLNGIKVTKGVVGYTERGGGIYAKNNSDLTITNSSISGNGSPTAEVINGTGVFSRGTLTMDNSEVRDNVSDYGGDGIGLNVETATITNSVISDNTARINYYDGGGIYVSGGGDVTVRNSTISGNTQGGISADSGTKTLRIYDSTIANNASDTKGGGVYCESNMQVVISGTSIIGNSSDQEGGGIGINLCSLTLTNSTVSGNSSNKSGGGLYTRTDTDDPVVITNSTIANNTATSGGGLFENVIGNNTGHDTRVINTILADNTNGDCVTDGANFVLTNSIVEDGGSGCGTPITGDPLLGALADNGGPTQTHLPGAGSSAIDAGDNTDCGAGLGIDADQRGFARSDGSCDIGAVEAGTATTAYLGWDASSVTVDESDGTVSLTVTRSGDTSSAVSVDYNAIDGTCVEGLDYVDTAGTLEFASGETTKAVKVSLVEDNLSDDGAFSVVLSDAEITGGTVNFVVIDTETAVVNVVDDDTSSSLINLAGPTASSTSETGDSSLFHLALTQAPTANVIIPIASFDESEGTVDTTHLTFTPDNWNLVQSVRVTGVDDAVADGNVEYSVGVLTAISDDGAFDGENLPDITLTNTDNEAPEVEVEIGSAGGLFLSLLSVLAFWRRRRN